MKLPLTGGCQCGAVRYEIAAAPLAVYACHCTHCQRQSGSAFALSLLAARDAIRITEGTPKIWTRPAEHAASGTPTDCVLCGTCGNRLYHLPSRNPAIVVVKPGTLDDTGWLAPTGHIFTKDAQPWFKIPPDAVKFPGPPPDFTALIKK